MATNSRNMYLMLAITLLTVAHRVGHIICSLAERRHKTSYHANLMQIKVGVEIFCLGAKEN